MTYCEGIALYLSYSSLFEGQPDTLIPEPLHLYAISLFFECLLDYSRQNPYIYIGIYIYIGYIPIFYLIIDGKVLYLNYILFS